MGKVWEKAHTLWNKKIIFYKNTAQILNPMTRCQPFYQVWHHHKICSNFSTHTQPQHQNTYKICWWWYVIPANLWYIYRKCNIIGYNLFQDRLWQFAWWCTAKKEFRFWVDVKETSPIQLYASVILNFKLRYTKWNTCTLWV